jgi:chloride channel protein, CIC family
VIDTNGRYRGTVNSQEVEQSVEGNAVDAIAGDLARSLPTVRATQSLHDAVQTLIGRDTAGVPVVSTDGSRLVGWINHHDILQTYSTRLPASNTADAGPDAQSSSD